MYRKVQAAIVSAGFICKEAVHIYVNNNCNTGSHALIIYAQLQEYAPPESKYKHERYCTSAYVATIM